MRNHLVRDVWHQRRGTSLKLCFRVSRCLLFRSCLFEEIDGKTRVRAVSHFASTEELEGALATGMIKGAVETWDRLEALLAKG